MTQIIRWCSDFRKRIPLATPKCPLIRGLSLRSGTITHPYDVVSRVTVDRRLGVRTEISKLPLTDNYLANIIPSSSRLSLRSGWPIGLGPGAGGGWREKANMSSQKCFNANRTTNRARESGNGKFVLILLFVFQNYTELELVFFMNLESNIFKQIVSSSIRSKFTFSTYSGKPHPPTLHERQNYYILLGQFWK